MKVGIVGGDFGSKPKKSKIMSILAENFEAYTLINGGEYEDLPKNTSTDLTIWAPNIDNNFPKQYPFKNNTKDVLIITKRVRTEEDTNLKAVSRIFEAHANAVIVIYEAKNGFRFKLIDSLNTVWCDVEMLNVLANTIVNFYNFCKSSVRVKSVSLQVETDTDTKPENLQEFIEINKTLAEHIQVSCGQRFFGNLSTRCSNLFPTMRGSKIFSGGMWVSPRNSNKENISVEDMIYCHFNDKLIIVEFAGKQKPSVDSPIQLKIYEACPQVNFMIHGHAFVIGAEETNKYYLCGDLREVPEAIKLIDDNSFGAINLKNHGFLLYADTLKNLKNIIKYLKFSYTYKDEIYEQES